MGRSTPVLVLLSACVGLSVTVRAQERSNRPLLLPPAPVKSSSPIRPVSYNASDLPPTQSWEREPEPEPDPEPRPRRPAAGLRPEGSRTIPARVVETGGNRRTVPDIPLDPFDDFIDRRSDLGRRRDYARRDRTASRVGDRLGTLFTRDPDQRGWFASDHGFDQFASPITNPFLFEDPRALTEVRPLFIYQKVPGGQPNFQGGSLWFLGTRASLAFTERIGVTLNKLGALGVYPDGASPYDSEFGFAEVWFGPKVVLIRDPEYGSIVTAGAVFQLPVGSSTVFQDTGNLSIAPYLSAGQTFLRTRLGSLNALGAVGYSISTDRLRSDYLYLSGHLDWDLFEWHRIYPVAELNWFQYTTNGQARPFSGEGRDLINFGSQSSGSNLLTWALGGRLKLTESAQIGAAYEMPLMGNRDLFQYRFTVDFILRY
jgi:hypothetical protein